MGRLARRLGGAVAIAGIAACGGRSDGVPAGFDVATEFARVRAAQGDLTAARERLDRARAEAAAGPAAAARGTASALDAQAAFDRAYARQQRALAVFLNRALNAAPGRPETRAALALYADSAVANARFLLERGGDRAQAIRILDPPQRAYRALGLQPPPELAATLDEARRAPAATPTPLPTVAEPGRRRRRPHR